MFRQIRTTNFLSRIKRFFSDSTEPQYSFVLKGFSPFCNRLDFELALGTFQADKVDPILSSEYLPTGNYLVTLPKSKYDGLQVHLERNFKDIYKVESSDSLKNGTILASSLDISESVVRFYAPDIKKSDTSMLEYLTESYAMDFDKTNLQLTPQVNPNAVENIKSSHSLYLLYFRNSYEAQRFVSDNSNKNYLGSKLILNQYVC